MEQNDLDIIKQLVGLTPAAFTTTSIASSEKNNTQINVMSLREINRRRRLLKRVSKPTKNEAHSMQTYTDVTNVTDVKLNERHASAMSIGVVNTKHAWMSESV